MMFDGLKPPYRTIVADPPWRYRVGGLRGCIERGASGNKDYYSTLSDAEIAAMPVAELAAPDACLFLWTTTPRLFDGRKDRATPADIAEAWGFSYKTLITWNKTGSPGLGSYFRVNTEHVLFCVRGSMKIPPPTRERNIFEASRTKLGHSVKPGAFYDLVERTCPGPYLELFARQPRLGWDHWGLGYEEKTA